MLELYKQGMVDLTQFTNFGELMVRRLQDGETALDLASLDDFGMSPGRPTVTTSTTSTSTTTATISPRWPRS